MLNLSDAVAQYHRIVVFTLIKPVDGMPLVLKKPVWQK